MRGGGGHGKRVGVRVSSARGPIPSSGAERTTECQRSAGNRKKSKKEGIWKAAWVTIDHEKEAKKCGFSPDRSHVAYNKKRGRGGRVKEREMVIGFGDGENCPRVKREGMRGGGSRGGHIPENKCEVMQRVERFWEWGDMQEEEKKRIQGGERLLKQNYNGGKM